MCRQLSAYRFRCTQVENSGGSLIVFPNFWLGLNYVGEKYFFNLITLVLTRFKKGYYLHSPVTLSPCHSVPLCPYLPVPLSPGSTVPFPSVPHVTLFPPVLCPPCHPLSSCRPVHLSPSVTSCVHLWLQAIYLGTNMLAWSRAKPIHSVHGLFLLIINVLSKFELRKLSSCSPNPNTRMRIIIYQAISWKDLISVRVFSKPPDYFCLTRVMVEIGLNISCFSVLPISVFV